jgi:hypothetical protein
MLPFKRAKKGLLAAFSLTPDKADKENDGLLNRLQPVKDLIELKHNGRKKHKGKVER